MSKDMWINEIITYSTLLDNGYPKVYLNLFNSKVTLHDLLQSGFVLTIKQSRKYSDIKISLCKGKQNIFYKIKNKSIPINTTFYDKICWVLSQLSTFDINVQIYDDNKNRFGRPTDVFKTNDVVKSINEYSVDELLDEILVRQTDKPKRKKKKISNNIIDISDILKIVKEKQINVQSN